MLRKVLLILIAVIFCAFTFAASAESSDYASMSFEDLNALKQAIDKEYYSRQEAGPRQIGVGQYLVGKDILPGTVYIAMTIPSDWTDYGAVGVYESEEAIEQKNAIASHTIYIGSEPKAVQLNEGNILVVSWTDLLISYSNFNTSDFFTYEPEGTPVPAGKYVAGEDIPDGRYEVFPGSAPSGYYEVFTPVTENGETTLVRQKAPEEYNRLHVYNPVNSTSITLKDGDVLVVEDPITMKKAQPLSFD